MPNKCAVFGCDTGYDGRETDHSVTLHSFPLKDAELCKSWVIALARVNFVPTKNSRVCSKHFKQSDFVEYSEDSNVTRHKEAVLADTDGKKKLKLRRLRADAVPSVFENMPSYYQTSSKPRTTTKATAATRRKQDQHDTELLYKSFQAADDISSLSLEDLKQRLYAEPTLPTGFHVAITEQSMFIFLLEPNDAMPTIAANVTVHRDLTVIVSTKQQMVPKSQFADIVNGSLKTMSQLINLMARVKSWTDESIPKTTEF